ncbi:class I adenylate-forming enzyme family protein [Streptomyces malaysiensis]|uniref:class I adenylate-forming enzyme family protein n=1 Tax=Streptomyces malaysiensis TaxID=92644 RepID=UPI002B2B35ED|nr:AMP-binding protein [Streptomyces malaysiensis]
MAGPANSLITWIGAVVRAHPRRPALVHERTVWTYQQLWDRAGAVARRLLALGLRPGQAVGLIGANELDYVANYFGILRAAGAAVTVSHLLDAAAVKEQLAWVGARAVFVGQVDAVVRDELAKALPVLPMAAAPDAIAKGRLPSVGTSSPCAIMPTSGTTGRPKSVVHSQGTMLHGALQLASVFPYGPDERGVVFLPLYACIPEQVLPMLCSGGSLEILPGFDVERVADACTRATTFDAVPTILSRLIEHAPLSKLAHLSWVTFASEAMPVPLLQRWWEELPGVEMNQFYGMTEVLTLTAAPHHVLRTEPATVGRAFPTTALTVERADGSTASLGGGELLAAGPGRMRGYHEDAAATKAALAPDGSMRTGDLGQIDERGLVFLTGRSKDVIISGGINIAPAEIEAVAARHPAVERVVVVGVRSERWGETPVVVAVPRPGRTVTADELLDHCRSRLVGYKRPTGAGLIDSLPTTGIGKAAKDAVRKMITDGKIRLVRVR